MDWISDPQVWIALATLTLLEIVLGIDNIVFISILAGKLPHAQQGKARRVGLLLAMVMRVGLLFSLTWVMQLKAPLFTVLGQEISGRDLILIGGGLFLLAKSTYEIHHKLEGDEVSASERVYPSFTNVIIQIMLLDIVFSLDSVITAVGMVEQIWVMITAVVVAVLIMILFSGPISRFVERHPTVKMLALSFLLLIGVTLIAEGLDQHIPKGYIYFAMAFSLFVEMLNLRLRPSEATPVRLPRIVGFPEPGKGWVVSRPTMITSIHKAETSDVEVLIWLSRRTINACYRYFLGDATVESFINSGLADRYITDNIPQCTVIRHDEQVVGFAVCRDNLIDLMMIDFSRQRGGFGTLLLEHVEGFLFESFADLRLESFEENDAANAFYRKNGWQEMNRHFDSDSGVNKIVFGKSA